MSANERYRCFVGLAYPHHYIPFPEDDNDGQKKRDMLERLIQDIAEKKKRLAAETKLATVTYQSTKDGATPYLQLMAQAQTKNENSNFNYDVAEAMTIAEKKLREDGYKFSFLSCANDGVSCDASFVVNVLVDFLNGKRSYSAHTDTNHNVKSSRYQLAIGGNNVKTIGKYMIDAGLLPKAGIPSNLTRPKDFASDLLVLKLASSVTVDNILRVESGDAKGQIILSLTLFFMRAHLTAINIKGSLSCKERISMLWSSFLFLLHVDGASIVTKRNWASESVSMCFMMMYQAVIRPHRLSSEPSEHSIAIMRNLCREFTVNDLISVVSKLSGYQQEMREGNLALTRTSEASGYIATLTHENSRRASKKVIELSGGNVQIESNLKLIQASEGLSETSSGESHALLIWKDLQPVLNKISANMRLFLKVVCGVKETHPMMDPFDTNSSTNEMVSRFQDIIKRTDSVFKNECTSSEVESDLTPQVDSTVEDELSIADSAIDESIVGSDKFICEMMEDLMDEIENGKGKDKTNEEIEEHCDEIGREQLKKKLGNIVWEKDEDGHEEQEDQQENENEDIHASFLRVLTSDMTDLLENPKIIITAMQSMYLGSREKGSIDREQKFKSLQGRWFGPKMEKINVNEDQNVIERGSNVSFNADHSILFVVTTVFQVVGKKWHLSPDKENPSWPVKKEEAKKYRLVVRKVTHSSSNNEGKIQMKEYSEIEDGLNVRKTYRFVRDISDIKSNIYKVII